MKSTTSRKKNSDNIFQQFVDATKQIAEDLHVNQKDVKIERYETPTAAAS